MKETLYNAIHLKEDAGIDFLLIRFLTKRLLNLSSTIKIPSTEIELLGLYIETGLKVFSHFNRVFIPLGMALNTVLYSFNEAPKSNFLENSEKEYS